MGIHAQISMKLLSFFLIFIWINKDICILILNGIDNG